MLEAEQLRADYDADERAQGSSRAYFWPVTFVEKPYGARIDSLFAVQEASLPDTGFHRQPAVKAPPAALELLNHERHAILDYFLGPKMLHAFVITRKETHYRVIPRPQDFERQMDSLLCMMEDPAYPASPADFRRISHALYNFLLAPLEDLIQETDQLTIVPDRRMRMFPFGVLVRSTEGEADYRTMHYMLRDFGIGYAFSVSHLAEVKKRPYVGEERTGIFSEAQSVMRNMGETFLPPPGAEALQAHWPVHEPEKMKHMWEFQRPEGWRIAHVALWDTKADFRLIRKGRAKVDLAVLSYPAAGNCSQKPESNKSLFEVLWMQHIGARAVVAPVWGSDPEAEAQIWEHFYAKLADRQYVDQSLRFAKMEYLNKLPSSEGAHPYFWASWMAFDDFSPLREPIHFPWYVFLAGAFLLIVFLGKKL